MKLSAAWRLDRAFRIYRILYRLIAAPAEPLSWVNHNSDRTRRRRISLAHISRRRARTSPEKASPGREITLSNKVPVCWGIEQTKFLSHQKRPTRAPICAQVQHRQRCHGFLFVYWIILSFDARPLRSPFSTSLRTGASRSPP